MGGDEVSQKLREKTCVGPTRETPEGQQIFPCGLPATSVFDDSFEVVGMAIDSEETVWPSDRQVFKNPEDYPTRPSTSWLYQRYPGVLSEAEGIRDSRFMNWMRPSALPVLRKPY